MSTDPFSRRPAGGSPWGRPAGGRPEESRLPSLEELLAGAHVVSLPMRVKFRGILQREALLLDGPVGWGEFAPSPSTATGSVPLARRRNRGRLAGLSRAAADQHPGQRHGPAVAADQVRKSWPASAGWTRSRSRSPNRGRAFKTTSHGSAVRRRPSGRDPRGRERRLGRPGRGGGAARLSARAGIRRTARARHRRARRGPPRGPRAPRC